MRLNGQIRLVCVFLSAVILASEALADEVLRITWPDGWEVRRPVEQGSVGTLQARDQLDGVARQTLQVTVVNIRSASKPIESSALRDLISRLRDAALRTSVETRIELMQLPDAQGYYFVASDRNYRGRDGEYRQMLEGVMLKWDCLINFTLLTNDAASAETRTMVRALAESKVENR